MPKSATQSPATRNGKSNRANGKPEEKTERTKSKKKIASYSLEVDLLQRIRKLAHEKDQYYSSVVSQALEEYIHQYYDNK